MSLASLPKEVVFEVSVFNIFVINLTRFLSFFSPGIYLTTNFLYHFSRYVMIECVANSLNL